MAKLMEKTDHFRESQQTWNAANVLLKLTNQQCHWDLVEKSEGKKLISVSSFQDNMHSISHQDLSKLI